MKSIGTLILAVALVACGSSKSPPAPTFYDEGQNAANCPISPTNGSFNPTVPVGTGPAGAGCVVAATDCAPVCCECAGVANSYWASECNEGVCTGGKQACNDAPSSTLCVFATTVYDDGLQEAPNCPMPATYTGQLGQPGSACTDAVADCSPACCQCTSSNNSYWASECARGYCSSDVQACDDAPSAACQ